MRRALVRGVWATMLASVVLLGGVAPTTLALTDVVRTAPSAVDVSTRAASRTAYQAVYKPALAAPLGWTGNVETCVAGTISAQAQQATLDAVNYFRGLVGLPAVAFDSRLSADAQQAALMMLAANQLSHYPDPTWPCHTPAGATSAGKSNLTIGPRAAGAQAMQNYMDDEGSGNYFVGHRRWILDPERLVMGSGSACLPTGRCANALDVLRGAAGPTPPSPQWLPWPAAGYFPVQLEPSGRWSLSSSDGSTDFSAATVSVERGGVELPVTIQPIEVGYGPNTIVWQVDPQYTTGMADRAFVVTVDGIVKGGQPTSYQYTVTLFDAEIDTEQTITFAPLANRTYGDGPLTLAASSSSGLPVTFSSTTPAACATSGTRGTTLTLLRAGSCTVAANQAGDTVRNPAPTVERSFTIAKKALTVTARDAVAYPGRPLPDLVVDYSGFVAGENLGNSGVTGAPSCSTTATSSSPSGSYPITCTAGTLSSVKYGFSFVAGDLTMDGGSLFTPKAPVRIQDSRPASKVGPYASPWSGGQTREVQVAGPGSSAGVPADADAVVLNVTVTGTSASSHLRIWPKGDVLPVVSSLNWQPGWTVPNAVTVKVGDGGKINVYNHNGVADVVIDVVGYYRDGAGGGYTSVAPVRIQDSRPASKVGIHATPWSGGQTREVEVAGVGGVPLDVDAVVLNVTVTGTSASSHLRIWPKGDVLPVVSSLNWQPGWTVPNAVTVKVGTGGKINLYNHNGVADVIVDVVGYFDEGRGVPFHPVTPVRIQDSRPGSKVGAYASPWVGGQTRDVVVTEGGGVTEHASAVLLNVTVTATSGSSHLRIWPHSGPLPLVSNLNWRAGWTIPNAVTASTSGGRIDIYNHAGNVDVIADVAGWYG